MHTWMGFTSSWMNMFNWSRGKCAPQLQWAVPPPEACGRSSSAWRTVCDASRPHGSGTMFPGRAPLQSLEGCSLLWEYEKHHVSERFSLRQKWMREEQNANAWLPKWCVSSLSFMFSAKTPGETFFLESSRACKSHRLETILSRAEPWNEDVR